jgi:single-strand DNA-binding protein
VKAFNRLAEIAGEHLHKGSRIYLEGRKRTESWDDKQTGGKRYRDIVYADRIEFLDSKGNGHGYQGPARTDQDANVADEEIPF